MNHEKLFWGDIFKWTNCCHLISRTCCLSLLSEGTLQACYHADYCSLWLASLAGEPCNLQGFKIISDKTKAGGCSQLRVWLGTTKPNDVGRAETHNLPGCMVPSSWMLSGCGPPTLRLSL